MANIEINEALWNGLSDADKAQITANLKKHRLLTDGDSIIGNPGTPQEEGIFDFNIPNPGKELCKIGCDAAAASAVALTLTGPALAAALVVIEAARQACRNSC